jgi:hypothetical protein
MDKYDSWPAYAHERKPAIARHPCILFGSEIPTSTQALHQHPTSNHQPGLLMLSIDPQHPLTVALTARLDPEITAAVAAEADDPATAYPHQTLPQSIPYPMRTAIRPASGYNPAGSHRRLPPCLSVNMTSPFSKPCLA